MELRGGIFNITYAQDSALIRTNFYKFILAVFLLFIAILPLLVLTSWVAMVNGFCIILISVIGLQILVGFSGQVSLGQAAFMAVGAYTAGVLVNRFDLPCLLVIAIAGFVAGLVGTFFGLPTFRVKGFYLALVTIAAQFIIHFLINHPLSGFTGGGSGIQVPAAQLGDFVFRNERQIYYLIVPITVFLVYISINLGRSKIGRALIAIRDGDLAAQSMGINIFRYKLLAFFICSVYAGVAGALWAFYARFIGMEQFTLWNSVWYMGMLMVGGMGNITAAIFGTLFLRGLEEGITTLGPHLGTIWPKFGPAMIFPLLNIVFGLIVILFLIFEPRGLYHRWKLLKRWFHRYPFPY